MTDTNGKDTQKNILETSKCYDMSIKQQVRQQNGNTDLSSQNSTNMCEKKSASMCKENFENETSADKVCDKKFISKDETQNNRSDKNQISLQKINETNKGLQDTSQSDCNKEPQEDDIPESFFDDLMSEDFIEGLNVVDTWEGDEATKPNPIEDTKKVIGNEKHSLKFDISPNSNIDKHQKDKIKYSEEEKDKKVKDYKHKNNQKYRKLDNISRSSSRECRGSRKRSRSGRLKDFKINDMVIRRDPNKTQRDILKDKDKCEKDKTTKMIYEKLKVVETGLVPPGMEMEVDIQNTSKSNQLEEGEISTEQESSGEKKYKSGSMERKKDQKPKMEFVRRSPYKESSGRKIFTPDYKREYRRKQSHSRSPRRRYLLRALSRSTERRIERRRSSRRTRSRSLEFRSLSREKRYRYRSPIRTSSLRKRNQDLFKEIDLLKVKLFAIEAPERSELSPIHGNIEHQLTQSVIPSATHASISNFQTFTGNSVQFPPVSNQDFIPLQPVPPPQQPHMNLDQQFFIGQPGIETSHYQLHPPMHNLIPSLDPSEISHNFQSNWYMEQSGSEQINYFNSSSQPNIRDNPYQQPSSSLQNQIVQEQSLFTMQQTNNPALSAAQMMNKKSKEDIFAKMFADNKITLSDYLSVTAKSTDNSNPVDIQNKIKVISHCQEALHEINGSAKTTGKFLLRKSQKCPTKPPNIEGLSPFKKVPVIKFQFTTYSKQGDDKLQLAACLNRLMFKLRKDVLFEEIQSDQKEPHLKTTKEIGKLKRTSHMSTQTDGVPATDFGCQVNFEDISSSLKAISKNQSLAKLTPAQLLAQAENEVSPPPAPKWTPSSDALKNRWSSNNEAYHDYDDINRRNFRLQGTSGWTIPNRNSVNALLPPFYNRLSDQSQHTQYGNRH